MTASGYRPRSLKPVCQKLVDLIETHAEELATNLLQDLLKNEKTPTYRTINISEVYERSYNVYRNLGRWISFETNEKEITDHYNQLGTRRRGEGFALSEVIHALILTRRNLWRKIQFEGLLDNIFDMTQAMDLNSRVLLYFDRAIFHTALGYEQGSPDEKAHSRLR